MDHAPDRPASRDFHSRLRHLLLDPTAPDRSAGGVEKRFVVLEGAGHNDVTFAARGAYRAAVTTFLRNVAESEPRPSGGGSG